MAAEPYFRCWAEIDLSALERNLKRIRSGLPREVSYVAVVKADAYGHGMTQTVSRLMHCGADMFAVANVHEAADIREIGSGWPILVLSALLPKEDEAIVEHRIIPTVSTLEEVDRFCDLAKKTGMTIPVHLKIDTGMGRLGVWHEDAVNLHRLIQPRKEIVITGIYTHFSSADTDPEFTEQQRRIFLNTLQNLGHPDPARVMIHADNSAGLESFRGGSPFNAVRVGLLQFGVLPYSQSLLSRVRVEPVLSFHTRIGLIKNVPSGTGISYGRTHVLDRNTRIAVLTAGYGDGIPTAMSNKKAQVLIRNQLCPIIGRVTMDQTIVDITGVGHVECGDTATLIGKQGKDSISVTDFSAWSQNIPWEVFCSITKRVPRVYKIDSAI